MRRALLLLVTSLPIAASLDVPSDAWAQPDDLATCNASIRAATKAEKSFWDDFRTRQRAAHTTWREPWLRRRDDTAASGLAPSLYVDTSGYRALFEDFEVLRTRRARAAIVFAKTDHADRVEVLLGALFDLADEIDAADASFDKAKPSGGWGTRDQRPSVLRHGLAAHQSGLERVLVLIRATGTTEAAIGAYSDAERADGKRSIVRRVALIDILARRSDANAFLVSRLAADETFVRIAALQGLVRPGSPPPSALVALLEDESPLVRRALLSEITNEGADSTGWIVPVHAAYERSVGQERAECIAALRALTGEGYGDDPSAWGEFALEHAVALGDGSFVRRAPPDEHATTTPAEPAAFTFYGAASDSRAVVFVLDNTTFQLTPANVEVQRTKWYGDWGFGAQGWEEEHESHRTAQRREFCRSVAAMGEDAVFGAVMNKESASVVVLGERKLLSAGKRGAKMAVDFLDENPPRAFRSELANLVDAMRIAGLAPGRVPDVAAPRADTALMICDGSLRGGHYMVPDAAVAAFVRLNRFRRLVVHTIRVCDAGPESERLLRGIAEASGGSYRWAKRPPRERKR